jgi:hypothetical protein
VKSRTNVTKDVYRPVPSAVSHSLARPRVDLPGVLTEHGGL